jgi:hypothetical protein
MDSPPSVVEKLLEIQSAICTLREQQTRLINKQEQETKRIILDVWNQPQLNVWEEQSALNYLKSKLTTENT